jgi:hypothetical protein
MMLAAVVNKEKQEFFADFGRIGAAVSAQMGACIDSSATPRGSGGDAAG